MHVFELQKFHFKFNELPLRVITDHRATKHTDGKGCHSHMIRFALKLVDFNIETKYHDVNGVTNNFSRIACSIK